MEIVYCGGLGQCFRLDDFDRGLARTLDTRPVAGVQTPGRSDSDDLRSSSRRPQGSTVQAPPDTVGTTTRETAAPGPPSTR